MTVRDPRLDRRHVAPARVTPELPPRFERIQDLCDPVCLARVLGPIRTIHQEGMKTVGFTTASHRRLSVEHDDGHLESLVLKRTSPATDWTALRTRDERGREA